MFYSEKSLVKRKLTHCCVKNNNIRKVIFISVEFVSTIGQKKRQIVFKGAPPKTLCLFSAKEKYIY